MVKPPVVSTLQQKCIVSATHNDRGQTGTGARGGTSGKAKPGPAVVIGGLNLFTSAGSLVALDGSTPICGVLARPTHRGRRRQNVQLK